MNQSDTPLIASIDFQEWLDLKADNARLREALEELHNADLNFVEVYNRMGSDDDGKHPTCADVKSAKQRCGHARDKARAALAKAQL